MATTTTSYRKKYRRPGPKPYSITYPPSDKIVYREASTAIGTTANTNNTQQPSYLSTLLRLQQGITSPRAITQTETFASNTRNASISPTSVPPSSPYTPYFDRTMMFPPEAAYPLSPSASDVDPRKEHIRNRVREASVRLNIPDPKPGWLKSHNYFLSGEYK